MRNTGNHLITLKLGLMSLFVAAASIAAAQHAEISGFITDPAGAVVPGAKVELHNTATNARRTTTSNDEGVYSLPALPSGVYRLAVEAQGFDRKVIEGITVEVGARITRHVELTVSGDNVVVTVNGNGSMVNTVDAAVSTVVDRKFVADIPLNGRSFQSLLTLTAGVTVVPSQGPGTSGGISVNGQRTEANYFTVDGVSPSSSRDR